MSPALPILQGTLDVVILGAISPKPIHGYGIATGIEERSGGQLRLEDAALYQALHRLERQGYIEAEWGASDNNRRARFYTLTPAGRRRLAEQKSYWRRYVRAIDALLRAV
jgi:PadR family transcriptional regulator PadR